jgi:hypothetical protein
MKPNPQLTDFPPAMVAACEAAIDAELIEHSEFVDFCIPHMGGYGCRALQVEKARLDMTAANFYMAQDNTLHRLEPIIIAAPRGHYANLRIHRGQGVYQFKVIMSDGYGFHPAIGGSNITYDRAPYDVDLLRPMVDYELRLCRQLVEANRVRNASCQAMSTVGIALGQQFHALEFGCGAYSTATVIQLMPESGKVRLMLTSKGSDKRIEIEVGANALAELAARNRRRKQGAADLPLLEHDISQDE